MAVRWVWSGAVSDDGFTVSAGLESGDTSCRLAVSTTDDMSNTVYGPVANVDDNNYVKASISGLDPATQYWYQLEVDGALDTGTTGKCRTFPVDGEPASFSFAFGSCHSTGSSSRTFDGIVSSGVDLFVHLGDKGYSDIDTNDQSLFRAAHESNFEAERQRTFHGSMPVAYTWSDHDYGPNNSDRTAPGREASAAVYRQIVPHWTLQDPTGIWQSFRVGRVLFVLTDERSYRDPNISGGTSKTMLGAAQITWLRNICEAAANDGTALIVWCSEQQINTNMSVVDEHWGKYPDERETVGDILSTANVPVMAITGDEHRSAFARSYIMGTSQIMICHHGSIESSDPVAAFGATAARGAHLWDWGTEHHKGYGKIEITDTGGFPKIRYTVNAVNQSSGAVTVPFNSGWIELKQRAYYRKRRTVKAHARRRTT